MVGIKKKLPDGGFFRLFVLRMIFNLSIKKKNYDRSKMVIPSSSQANFFTELLCIDDPASV